MASTFSEAELKALTVVKLKELLAERSLAVTGRKDELVSRLLAAAASSDDRPTLDSTGPAASTDEPDGNLGLTATGLATQAVASTETDRDAQHADQGLKTGSEVQQTEQAQTDTATATTETDAAAAAAAADEEEAIRIEMEKRKARAAKFGTADSASAATAPATATAAGKKEPAGGAVDDSEEVKRKRAERFGTELPTPAAPAAGDVQKSEANQQQNGDAKVKKSLALLDSALGSNRRPKPESNKQSNPAPSSKSSAPANGGGVTNAAAAGGKVSPGEAAAEPAAAVAADPELQKRLEEEEEKKRKRAARFGNAPSEPAGKKAKVDETSAV
ncbi:hypothetical protein JCM3774_005512 [Rhodotorula dairenensis]